MAKDICANCKHERFTSVPEWYRGKFGWCKAKGIYVNPRKRKYFCKKFVRREKSDSK